MSLSPFLCISLHSDCDVYCLAEIVDLFEEKVKNLCDGEEMFLLLVKNLCDGESLQIFLSCSKKGFFYFLLKKEKRTKTGILHLDDVFILFDCL